MSVVKNSKANGFNKEPRIFISKSKGKKFPFSATAKSIENKKEFYIY
jgi:hypothetical protein